MERTQKKFISIISDAGVFLISYIFMIISSRVNPKYRGRGTGVAGVARATPKIGDLYSKIFENSQNLIFLITRATPR